MAGAGEDSAERESRNELMSERFGDLEFDPQLLDLHLGHLTSAEQADLRGRFAEEPGLAAQNEALTSVFEALGVLRTEPAPRDLVGRTMARVQAAGPPLRVAPKQPAGRRLERVVRLGPLRDALAVAAVIVLVIGLGVPSVLHVRERQQRLGCSWNMAQIGSAVQQYASVFNSSLPFTGWSNKNTWQPTNEPGVETVPNRRHVYPLLRSTFVRDPRVFVCPSQPHVPMPSAEVPRHSDFLEARNVSYAYQNMAGVRPSANDDPRLPILADENPLFVDGRPLIDALRLGSGPASNSLAHRRAGQNILTLRGEVRWTKSPQAGVNGDNIWVLDGVARYTGREGPQSKSDAHLLK
jgi:hypothetical protein